MALFRAAENPLIRPQDLRLSRDDFEIIGVFNAGTWRSPRSFGEPLQVRPLTKGSGPTVGFLTEVGEYYQSASGKKKGCGHVIRSPWSTSKYPQTGVCEARPT